MYCQKIIFWTLLLGKNFTNDIIYTTEFTDIFIYCRKGITYSFFLSLRPETPTTSVAHYLFPTSFQDIGHIAEQLIGQTPSGFEAEIIEVQQKSGTCQQKLPSKMQIKISYQNVFRYFISYYFSCSSRDSGFWRTSELELASSHVLKNTLSRHYNTLQPTYTRKKFQSFLSEKAKTTSKTQRLLSIHAIVNIYFDFWNSFLLITVNHQNLQKFIRRPSKLEKKWTVTLQSYQQCRIQTLR